MNWKMTRMSMIAALASLQVAAHAAPVSRVCAVGGLAEFREFLRQSAGCELVFRKKLSELPLATATNALFAIAPRYAIGEKVVPPFTPEELAAFADAARRGNRFYFENVCSEGAKSCAFLGVETFGDRIVPLGQKILESDAGLLQIIGGGYLPGARCAQGAIRNRPSVAASVSDALGVGAVFVPAQERSPAVAVSADGRRASSLVRLACFEPLRMRPYSRWRAFYAKLFAPLLGVEESKVAGVFEKAWANNVAASGKRASDDVVRAALAWHEKSGRLFSPDGRKGMREAVLFSGSFGWRSELRTDCNLMTGALFVHAGKMYERDDWTALGRNLADNILDRGNQTDEGYFRWFDREASGYGKHFVYATDHGRSMLAVANLYEATGDRRYLDAARKAADAFLAWQSDDGLVTICFDLRKSSRPEKGHSENPVCYYDNIPALFKIAKHTGERKYSDAALKCVRTMSAKFPNFDFGSSAFYSANSVYGRYLLIAAAAQRATDDDFSASINGVLDFYRKNQHDKGGISEIDIRLVAHEEAGVGISDGSDHVADLLYCNNFSFAALSILMKLPPEKVKGIDMAKARRIYGKLRDFLSEVQIASPEVRLDGAWMRAYDMDVGEWHGLNKDLGWGPYCIETGWTMGTIPAVFLFDGKEGSYF